MSVMQAIGRKIPTIFERSEDRRSVVDQIVPGCEWVLEGEGVPTRKWDGIGVLIERDGLNVKAWVRRVVKPGAAAPNRFRHVETDDVTGISVGWEPAELSGYAKYIGQAVLMRLDSDGCPPWTYELCGPKVNGNPEKLATHELLAHGEGSASFADAPRDYDGLREWLTERPAFEGIVWHHPDGRMAKIKRRDFKRS